MLKATIERFTAAGVVFGGGGVDAGAGFGCCGWDGGGDIFGVPAVVAELLLEAILSQMLAV